MGLKTKLAAWVVGNCGYTKGMIHVDTILVLIVLQYKTFNIQGQRLNKFDTALLLFPLIYDVCPVLELRGDAIEPESNTTPP